MQTVAIIWFVLLLISVIGHEVWYAIRMWRALRRKE